MNKKLLNRSIYSKYYLNIDKLDIYTSQCLQLSKNNCLNKIGCVWCLTVNNCKPGDIYGPFDASCTVFDIGTECSMYHSCHQCMADVKCNYCLNKNTCVPNETNCGDETADSGYGMGLNKVETFDGCPGDKLVVNEDDGMGSKSELSGSEKDGYMNEYVKEFEGRI
eukprot:Mrub_10859.p1 GENE.Mrub_10859~~Mrub_10859.p1  ORF type:complete len:195 (+),score=22.45 Mrub_10859:90-587(+)